MRNQILFLGTSLTILHTAAAVSVVSGGIEYIGRRWSDEVEQESFLGIPYAQAARFERPVAPTVSSPFNATAYGPARPQSIDTSSAGLLQSEDCLSVNIWRPIGTTAQSSLPVMLYIYGGSFTGGFSADYQAGGLGDVAKSLGKPIIGVVFNYRTGIFGFPVGAKAEENGALNLGLYDQRAAIEWVKNHIADFGGDKTRVTLWGHSSGAASVGLQMFYNSGQIGTAFHRGIMQSGGPNTFSAQRASTPVRETTYSHLVNNTGCATAADTFACLKTVDFDALSTAHWSIYKWDYDSLGYALTAFAPTVADGDSFLPIRPYEAIAQGKFVKIPFIAGSTKDDGTPVTPIFQTKQESIDFLTTAIPVSDFGFSDDVPAVTKMVNQVYSDDPADGAPYGTGNETFGTSPYWKQLASIETDILFEGPRRYFLRAAVKRGVNVWSYRWLQHVGAPVEQLPLAAPRYGISHVQDIFAEFRNPLLSLESLATGATFIDYLTSFAYSGAVTPATSGLPAWKKYNQGANSLQLLNNDYKMIPDNFRAKEIDYVINKLIAVN